MHISYDSADLSTDEIELNGHVWKRDRHDTDAYQWMREMNEEEYDWDRNKIDRLIGGTLIRMVTLWLVDKRWEIQACETAGPQYHRSGFCEVMSSEYTATAENH